MRNILVTFTRVSQMAAELKNQNSILTRIETLPSGIHSYYRTLAVMAQLVRASVQDYSLKLWLNNFYLTTGIKGHDFSSEVVSLFFSFVTAFATRATRLTLNSCRTRCGRYKRLRAIVTTRLLYLRLCLRAAALLRALCAAGLSLTLWRTSGLRLTAIGRASGLRSIQPMSARYLEMSSIFRFA